MSAACPRSADTVCAVSTEPQRPELLGQTRSLAESANDPGRERASPGRTPYLRAVLLGGVLFIGFAASIAASVALVNGPLLAWGAVGAAFGTAIAAGLRLVSPPARDVDDGWNPRVVVRRARNIAVLATAGAALVTLGSHLIHHGDPNGVLASETLEGLGVAVSIHLWSFAVRNRPEWARPRHVPERAIQ